MEAVVGKFKTLYRFLSGSEEEKHEKISHPAATFSDKDFVMLNEDGIFCEQYGWVLGYLTTLFLTVPVT